jgi:hypothetical protein
MSTKTLLLGTILSAVAGALAADLPLGNPLYVGAESAKRHPLSSLPDLAELMHQCLSQPSRMRDPAFGQLADPHPFPSKTLDRAIPSTLPLAEVRQFPLPPFSHRPLAIRHRNSSHIPPLVVPEPDEHPPLPLFTDIHKFFIQSPPTPTLVVPFFSHNRLETADSTPAPTSEPYAAPLLPSPRTDPLPQR